jgi:hypothetical protein
MSYELPRAKAGDVIEIHVPPLGAWKVDAVVEDPRHRQYLKVSRRTGGSTEFRYVAASGGYQIILTPQPIDESSTRIDQPGGGGLTESDRWAAINAGNVRALKAQRSRPTEHKAH